MKETLKTEKRERKGDVPHTRMRKEIYRSF
jgi:hypothetical protein